jgi:heat-inducible transcriptional repressor
MKKNELRKEKVLISLIDEFIKTCEPVSSKLICEKYIKNASPATIRIDLNKLEQENFIFQQHTSSGRIPTIKGFRKYIKKIDTRKKVLTKQKEKFIRDILLKNFDNISLALQYIMQFLAKETGQLSFIAEPEVSYGYLKKIDAFKIGDNKLLFVVSLNSGLDKTVILNPHYNITHQQLRVIVRYVNDELAGLRIIDIQNKYLDELYEKQKEENVLIVNFLDEFRKALAEITNYYLNFDGNISFLEQPEFESKRSILTFLNFIQRQDHLLNLIQNNEIKDSTTVLMGEELGRNDLAGYTLIYSKYKIFGVPGYLGIIGPLRMDYKKNIPLIKEFSEIITKTTEKGVLVRKYGQKKIY